MSSIDTDINEPGLSVDERDVFFSIGAGYSFNKMFAIEAGYVDLGEFKASEAATGYTASVSADGFYFGPRLTFEITPQFEAYGRAGVFAWDAEVTAPRHIWWNADPHGAGESSAESGFEVAQYAPAARVFAELGVFAGERQSGAAGRAARWSGESRRVCGVRLAAAVYAARSSAGSRALVIGGGSVGLPK